MVFSQKLLDQFNVVDWAYTEKLSSLSFDRYEHWVESGDHGSLKYLADHRKDLRKNLDRVYPGAKSACVFLFSYEHVLQSIKDIKKSEDYNGLSIASYALAYEGEDYHFILKDYLEKLGNHIQKKHPELSFKISLDAHPVLERDLAYRSGLGFFGKNSMLISKEHGSFFLIGSLILDKTVANQKNRSLEVDHCGSCRACIDACPTDAIDEASRTLKADKCISTYTIELFNDKSEPPKGIEKASGEIFGCDICQDVCPWNKRRNRLNLISREVVGEGLKNIVNYFLLRDKNLLLDDLMKLSNKKFKKIFSRAPMGRTGRVGMLKNIRLWFNSREK